jgi:peptide/nickel transport system permease protein
VDFFSRKKLRVVLGLWTFSIIVVAGVGPYVAPFSPLEINFAEILQPPSKTHLFGTDDMGRDLFSRVLHGAPLSIKGSFSIVGAAILIGTTLGLLAGFFGGAADTLTMRLADMFLSFPFLVLAMAIAAALGPSLSHAIMALIIIWWPPYTRLIRGQVLAIKEKDFVSAARALGAGNFRIMVHHILPSCFGPVIARMTTDLGYAILATAALGFVGLGAQPPSPEWGAIIAKGRSYIMDSWWYATFPGLAISLSVMGFSFFGDEIHEGYSHI